MNEQSPPSDADKEAARQAFLSFINNHLAKDDQFPRPSGFPPESSTKALEALADKLNQIEQKVKSLESEFDALVAKMTELHPNWETDQKDIPRDDPFHELSVKCQRIGLLLADLKQQQISIVNKIAALSKPQT